MYKYDFVEDYYLVIDGFVDPATLKSNGNFWSAPIISLARYDVSFVTNVSSQAQTGTGLTTRQAELAVRILSKYRRQLLSKNIDVSEIIEAPRFKYMLREVDRVSRLDFDGEHILLKFPYNSSMIEQLRKIAADSQGRLEWNRDKKVWESAVTEHNLMTLVTWAKSNQFEISSGIKELVELVDQTMSKNPLPKLVKSDNGYEVIDAESSLIDYLEKHTGHSEDWLPKLADLSGVLGYTISRPVEKIIEERWGKWIMPFFTSKDIALPGIDDITHEDLSAVLDYCDIVGRKNIVIYEPDLSNKLLTMVQKLVDTNDIDVVGNSLKVNWEKRVIHLLKPACSASGSIPMLITSSGMLFGATKQLMTQQAEKVVYFTAGVYNKSSRKTQG